MSFTGNNQAATAVASTTTLTGLLANYGITQESMGIIAAFIGILLSVVMLWGQVRRILNDNAERRLKESMAKLSEEKAKLELEKLRRSMDKPAQ